MNKSRKVILCLNMIVKNEGEIITRLLDSVSSIIDCYCICDTGSTDGTHKIIKKYFDKRNIPGKILHEPFQNFEHNRNVALKGCETLDKDCDIDLDNAYALLLDADMMLEIKPEFNKNILQRALEKADIKYEHHSELGLPYPIQNAYKDGGLSTECAEQWYRWHIDVEVELEELINHFKATGRTAIMCMERYAKAMRDQKIHCHRHFLAKLLQESKQFENRIDL